MDYRRRVIENVGKHWQDNPLSYQEPPWAVAVVEAKNRRDQRDQDLRINRIPLQGADDLEAQRRKEAGACFAQRPITHELPPAARS